MSSLPSTETTFVIDAVGEDTGQHFEGSFTYKRPNIRNRNSIALLHNRLKLSQTNLSEDTDMLMYMVAFLKYTLIDAPKWWEESDGGLELFDIAPITEVFVKTREFEEEWKKQVFPEEVKKDDVKQD